jgi:hypothetical protein
MEPSALATDRVPVSRPTTRNSVSVLVTVALRRDRRCLEAVGHPLAVDDLEGVAAVIEPP